MSSPNLSLRTCQKYTMLLKYISCDKTENNESMLKLTYIIDTYWYSCYHEERRQQYQHWYHLVVLYSFRHILYHQFLPSSCRFQHFPKDSYIASCNKYCRKQCVNCNINPGYKYIGRKMILWIWNITQSFSFVRRNSKFKRKENKRIANGEDDC